MPADTEENVKGDRPNPTGQDPGGAVTTPAAESARPLSAGWYDGRVFRSVANSPGGDVDGTTIFHYRHEGSVVWATYAGGSVLLGTLLATVNAAGSLDMRYQHLTVDGHFRAGRCSSRPEMLPDGRLRLHEQWEWTDGAEGHGESIIEEVRNRV